MLFYVKFYGTPSRIPKTSLVNISSTRAHFIPSFAKHYGYNKSVKKNVQEQPIPNRLDRDLISTQTRQQFDTPNAFPRAEFQLLPTSSESNFAGSSEMRQSSVDQTEVQGQVAESKRLSQRYTL